MRRLLFAAAVALLLAAGGAFYALWPKPPGEVATPTAVVKPLWVFEAPDPGGIIAAPLVTDDAVYVVAYRARGFRLTGVVYALDPATGRQRWRFDAGGEMHATGSSPALAGGRLFFGEGMHANFDCKLYCLDAAAGTTVWTAQTGDHVEAGPLVDGDAVYFAAGNEGVYAVNAADGAPRWNYAADLHVDTTPCRVADVVIFGSGPSRRFKTNQVTAVAAATGKRRWQTPTRLPAWGSPAAAGNRVVVGLGNGRLTEPAHPPEVPAGGVVCLDAATGDPLWTFAARDSVIQHPVVDGDRVYFGSRDGNVYGLGLTDGAKRFEVAMGGPVIAPPAAAGDRLFAASLNGQVRCLDAGTGGEVWHLDLAELTRAEPRVYAPVRVHRDRLYVAGEFRRDPTLAGSACLYCFPVGR